MDIVIPFNSIGNDRVYDADDVAAAFAAILSDGVHPNPGDSLMVTAAGGYAISINPGRCVIKGRLGVNNTARQLTITPPSGSLPRIDAIMARCDLGARDIIEVVVQGVPASSPAAPLPIRIDGGIWELCLAHIRVEPQGSAITTANITDTRHNASICGIMNSLITADATGLFGGYGEAWQAFFAGVQSETESWEEELREQTTAWLQDIQDLLSDEAETNIASEVANHNVRIQSLETNMTGTMFELARWDGVVPQDDWLFDDSLSLWKASIAAPADLAASTDIAITIAAASLREPVLGSGAYDDGELTLFASALPNSEVNFSVAAFGRRM